jgi:hypothetical protein
LHARTFFLRLFMLTFFRVSLFSLAVGPSAN